MEEGRYADRPGCAVRPTDPPGVGGATYPPEIGTRAMRILASNPDTIGDLVLRQPLYGALAAAGHELMLVVRPLLEPIVPLVAPGARIAIAPEHLYNGSLEPGDASLAGVAEAAAAFAPDVLLVAPFQWTAMEERLAMALPGARRVAMNGRLFADPSAGPSPPSVIRPSIEVAEDMPETHKNQRLACAILGRAVTLPDPRIEATAAQLRAAEAELVRLGMRPGEYWIACVGDTPNTAVRNWRADRWAALLAHWARAHGRTFLLVGSQAEGPAAAGVREAMGDQRGSAKEWFGAGDGALDVLVGLIALSAGYVGRDTGPMHLAAALRRPVLAVFGGGTWPRFLPAGDASVSITVGVPCAGCGWLCHLPESYCVKEVPLSEAVAAVAALEGGEVRERRVRVLGADAALLARIGREGAASARERTVRLSVEQRRVKEAQVTSEPMDAALSEAPLAVPSAAEPRTWVVRGGAAEGAVHELEQTRHALAQARGRIAQLEANAAEMVAFRAQQAAQITSTREYLVEVKARVAALEKRLEDRTAELIEARADLGASREQVRLEGVAGAQVAVLKAELDKCRAEIAVRVRESVDYQARIKGMTAQIDEAMQYGNAEHRKRESHLVEKLNEVRARLTAAEGRLADQRQHLTRLQGEKAALAELTRQQDEQVAVLRSRVHDLAVSRWRRLGQRLRLAMELPWEGEYRNGSASARPSTQGQTL